MWRNERKRPAVGLQAVGKTAVVEEVSEETRTFIEELERETASWMAKLRSGVDAMHARLEAEARDERRDSAVN